tara:strand:- start:1226 stop:2170 length:945 start_codon:yes stop_codon:yes gene_type:complete
LKLNYKEMGIKHLYKTIKEFAPKAMTEGVSLQKLKGAKVVIDLYLYLHRFHATQGSSFTGLFHQITTLRQAGIIPIYVIDGKPPELKNDTMIARHKLLEDRQKELKKKEEEGATKEELFKLKNLAYRVDEDELKFCKKLFDLLGVPWIQSKGEADVLMASLVKDGKADACLTEDGDVLALGCPVLWRKFKGGMVDIYVLDDVLKGLQLDLTAFRELCVLSGCDYLNTVKGIGPKTALRLLREYDTIMNFAKGKIPETYAWQEALRMFEEEAKSRKKINIDNPKPKALIAFLKKEMELSDKRLAVIQNRASALMN